MDCQLSRRPREPVSFTWGLLRDLVAHGLIYAVGQADAGDTSEAEYVIFTPNGWTEMTTEWLTE